MEKSIITIGKGENMRVYQFAKEIGKDSGDLIDELKSVFKFDIKSHLSGITEEQMQEVKALYKKRDHDMDQEEEKTAPKISDMIGGEGTIQHKEAMKDTFNMDDNIETSIDSARKAREQYAKTVKKIVADPEEWSNLSVKKQEVIVEKPGWFAKLFSWWVRN